MNNTQLQAKLAELLALPHETEWVEFKDYCQRMVVELLQKLTEASRPEIESLLLSKLSDSLDDAQKRNFVQNLLKEMRQDKVIQPVQGKRGPGAKCELSKPGAVGGD